MVSDEMQMSKTSIFWFHSSLSAMACLLVRSVMKSLIPDVLPGLLVGATYNVFAGASPEPCWGGLCGCGASQKCTSLLKSQNTLMCHLGVSPQILIRPQCFSLPYIDMMDKVLHCFVQDGYKALSKPHQWYANLSNTISWGFFWPNVSACRKCKGGECQRGFLVWRLYDVSLGSYCFDTESLNWCWQSYLSKLMWFKLQIVISRVISYLYCSSGYMPSTLTLHAAGKIVLCFFFFFWGWGNQCFVFFFSQIPIYSWDLKD